ncbi:hypothetical protein [Tropicimonas aquimaris]|uniref:Secreted protein n=1 Tax=Tropicimonas aquimaris TaxID=914152 RepID=A0ABW3IL91_9RHOB
MRHFLLLACLLALAACLPERSPPGPQAAPGTPEFFQEQKASCEARGGQFGKAPGGATSVCFITTRDANETCSQNSDCEGMCLARSRTCTPVVPMFGCNEVLLDGGIRAEICLD